MTSTNDEALATADHVGAHFARRLHRIRHAQRRDVPGGGVPSRTAIGLIYADAPGGPVLASTCDRVWVRGSVPLTPRWAGLRGATHLKITDHSCTKRTVTPLLPVVRVLGKVSIQVVSANGSP